MKEASAASKNWHQLSTPMKVNFEVSPKISSHYKYFVTSTLVDIGLKVSQRGDRVKRIFF